VPTAVVPLEDRTTLIAEEVRSVLIPPEIRTEVVQDVRTVVVT
jgi:hypothetical protein